eukprot:1098705-Heterocapsa_arctica.AAC.1
MGDLIIVVHASKKLTVGAHSGRSSLRSVVFLDKFLDGHHEVSQIDGLTMFVSPGLYAVLPLWLAA